MTLAVLLAGCDARGTAQHARHSNPAGAAPDAMTSGEVQLVDIDGRRHGSLASPAHGKWSVLIFVRTDCPVSNHYAAEIRRICSAYTAAGINCLLVYPDPHDTAETVRAHLASFGHTLPAVLDHGHTLVNRAGATITPEAAVFGSGATLAYRGRIDDLYAGLGRPRQHVTEHSLRDALDDLVAGRTVRNARTSAVGCYIE